MEAVGKNLFAFFSDAPSTPSDDDVVVHVHFGMSGAWAVFDSESEPEVRATTRLRLEEIAPPGGGRLSAHLSAMTVRHGGLDLYDSRKGALGEDPLRTDADPSGLYSRVVRSRKSIGQLVMDQSFFAGPGNIYRAEILFLAGVHPSTPGSALSKEEFDRVWEYSVSLMRRGYDTGSILTVDAGLDPAAAARGERRYIYNRSECARCGGGVSSWDMSGRTCYACEGGCQPRPQRKIEGAEPTRSAGEEADASSGPAQQQHVPFISHCAPVGRLKRLEEGGPEGLTVREIRDVIVRTAGEAALPPKSARKAVQVEALKRLLTAREEDAIGPSGGNATAAAGLPLPPPRVSAEDAAREKAASGESRAVEHVAELSRDQAARAVVAVTPSPGKRRPSSRAGRGGEGSRRKSPRKL